MPEAMLQGVSRDNKYGFRMAEDSLPFWIILPFCYFGNVAVTEVAATFRIKGHVLPECRHTLPHAA